jgi:hypothetical protein
MVFLEGTLPKNEERNFVGYKSKTALKYDIVSWILK